MREDVQAVGATKDISCVEDVKAQKEKTHDKRRG